MPSRTIFVANIPFETSEEQLAHVFAEAGPVQGVEIKFDNEGKPRGYAFVQFYDEAAADSAVRNLTGVQVKGRQLRIELSSDTPNHRQSGGQGGRSGGGRGGGPGGGGRGRSSPPPFSRPPPPGASGPGAGYGAPPPQIGYGGPPPPPPARVDLGMVPPGQDLPRGENAMDQISRTLASVSPGQMQDVMAGMKTLISTQPDQARQLLSQKPQLAYALFQAMLLMNIVDPQVLQHVKPAPAPTPGYGPPPTQQPNYPPQQSYQPPPPPQSYQQQAPPPPQSSDPRLARNSNPANSYRPPAPAPGPGGYGGGGPPPPAPGPPALSPQVQAMLSTLPQDQRDTLVSVLQMTPDQINALDQAQRQSVMQLRQQFLGV